jgi:putative ABC transport system substrate-binding protein
VRRRKFITLLGGVVFASPLVAHGQQATVPVVGFLSQGWSAESDTIRISGLRRGLGEAGFVEGRNVTIEYRWAGDQFDKLPALAADLLLHRVAVIVTPGLQSALAAKAATPTVPIVFVVGVDPVQVGLVDSVQRLGGNLTGVNGLASELGAKVLQVLHEILPTTTMIAFLKNPRNQVSDLVARDVLVAARAVGVEVQVLQAGTEAEIDAAFASLAQARTGTLFVPNDIFFNDRITQLVALAARYAVPTVYGIREFPLAGGLMSYGASHAETYRLSGLQVARILKGEKPEVLPVIQLTKIELVVNLKTAKVLGLTIPPTLLARADEVIE